jgi:catechol 2,3-dioxygenase-like lactoylglutathione lyase family enzyme
MAIDVRGMAPLLQVYDMPTSIKFYCAGLGFKIVSTDGKQAPYCDWVLLRLNGVELMLNTAYEAPRRPLRPDLSRIASHKDVGIFFGCPDVDGAYIHLRESIPTATAFASSGRRTDRKRQTELLGKPAPPVSAIDFAGREMQRLV